MKHSKDQCKALASLVKGIEFVCWESDDNSYIFQSGNYRDGFYTYRLLECDMYPESAKLMFTAGLSDARTPASVKRDIQDAKREHKLLCIQEGLLTPSEVQESLVDIAELQALYDNMTMYRIKG